MSSATATADDQGGGATRSPTGDQGGGATRAPTGDQGGGATEAPGPGFDGDQPRASPLMVGVIVWLTSELMFFGGLFAAWFTLRAENLPTWPPPNEAIEPLRMLIGTALLVTSSLTIHLCLKNTKAGRRQPAIRWLSVTFLLGAVFLVNELLEWRALGFPFSASAFSTIFYLLTGFHGAHVLVGLILMVLVGWVVYSDESKLPASNSMHAVGYYWHFVDVVWILLYLIVYVQTWAYASGR